MPDIPGRLALFLAAVVALFLLGGSRPETRGARRRDRPLPDERPATTSGHQPPRPNGRTPSGYGEHRPAQQRGARRPHRRRHRRRRRDRRRLRDHVRRRARTS
ncbi:hypothetical protein HBB16_03970 [Pseudonocardia sp. MCCB 268]|nr:hypothetical protein [Pseudonocardia cytotoxica]